MSCKHDHSAAGLDSMVAKLSRRSFLRGSAAAAGAAGVGIAFAPTPAKAAAPTKTLLYLFLRGGNDGLSFVVPTSGVDRGHYMDAREQTRLFPDAQNVNQRTLPLDGGNLWGLHPFATGFKQLWDLGKLAVVHAAGHQDPDTYTRSHFDAQEQIELGTPGVMAAQAGWLTRHLMAIPAVSGAVFTAMVSGQNPPSSLNGWSDVATLDSTGGFHPDPYGAYADTRLRSLRTLYPGSGDLDLSARAAIDAVDLLNSLDLDSYTPGGGVTYPNSGLGNDLRLVAQLMRLNLGIGVATVDYGGWDTHNRQDVFGGYGNRIRELCDAVSAFYRDLAGAGRANDVAIIVQTEFGRQVTENADFGTDHGLANPMFVIGGGVTGGLYGTFPGLNPASQTVGDAVRPTTDFRQVQATVLAQLMSAPNVEAIFDQPGTPSFTYSRMGFA
jgi:uncharacterized protein (DUF1501 family)